VSYTFRTFHTGGNSHRYRNQETMFVVEMGEIDWNEYMNPVLKIFPVM
jgi:hypothetical protein